MDDLGRRIRRQVEDAVAKAVRRARASGESASSTSGGANVAYSANVASDGRTTSVYSDDDVTIVQRDGKTEVFPHRGAAAEEAPTPESEA